MKRKILILPLAVLPLTFSSCGDEEIRTYKVATDTSETPQADPLVPSQPDHVHDHTPEPTANAVIWQAPTDWKEVAPGQFQVTAFTTEIGGKISVSKLPGDAGGIPANINRWRGQVGLDPLPDEKIGGQPLEVAESNNEMLLFNLIPPDASPDTPGILAAILPLASESWYFKFTASSGELQKNGGVFMSFLRSVRTPGSKTAPAPQPNSSGLEVTAPEGWAKSEGSAMRAASFGIVGEDGASADISVIPLPGDSGSILDNVNRWRTQLHLNPLESAEDPALGKMIEGPEGEYFLSHMVSTEGLLDGKKAAIGTAILAKPGKTWFFKITGEAALVEANREKFEEFVRSAKFK